MSIRGESIVWGSIWRSSYILPAYRKTFSSHYSAIQHYQLNFSFFWKTLFKEPCGVPTTFLLKYGKKLLPWVKESVHIALFGKIVSAIFSHYLVKHYSQIHLSLQLHFINDTKKTTVPNRRTALTSPRLKKHAAKLACPYFGRSLFGNPYRVIELFVQHYRTIFALFHFHKRNYHNVFPIGWETLFGAPYCALVTFPQRSKEDY